MLTLESALPLTRGNPFGAWGLLSHLNPVRGSYTGVTTCEDAPARPVIGQVRYTLGERSAHLAFLAPENQLLVRELPELLESLTVEAANWGAMHLIAEVDEGSPAFVALRRAGFSVYAWQRIWNIDNTPNLTDLMVKEDCADGEDAQITEENHQTEGKRIWKNTTSKDRVAIQGLYHSLVPAIVLPVEPLPEGRLTGLIYRSACELIGFVLPQYGPLGIYLQPFIHPGAEQTGALLAEMVRAIPERRNRPVYICVRSYQGWLEPYLEKMNAGVSPRQAVMVKHMAITQRANVLIPGLEKVNTERPAPVAHFHLPPKGKDHPFGNN